MLKIAADNISKARLKQSKKQQLQIGAKRMSVNKTMYPYLGVEAPLIAT